MWTKVLRGNPYTVTVGIGFSKPPPLPELAVGKGIPPQAFGPASGAKLQCLGECLGVAGRLREARRWASGSTPGIRQVMVSKNRGYLRAPSRLRACRRAAPRRGPPSPRG